MHLIIDTETSGKAVFEASAADPRQPWLVQVGAILYDEAQQIRGELSAIIKPEGWTITPEAMAIHGISQEIAMRYGIPLRTVLSAIAHMAKASLHVSSFNWAFDGLVIEANFCKLGLKHDLKAVPFCTMEAMTPLCALPRPYGSGYKWPKLSEAYVHLFKSQPGGAHDALHDALHDARAAARIYFHLWNTGSHPHNPK